MIRHPSLPDAQRQARENGNIQMERKGNNKTNRKLNKSKKKQNTNNHHNNQKEMQKERTGPININLSCSIFHIFSFFVSSLLFHHFHVFIFQGPGIYFPEFILSKFLFSDWIPSTSPYGRAGADFLRIGNAAPPMNPSMNPSAHRCRTALPNSPEKNLLGRSGPAMTSLESHSRLISIQCN